MVSVRGTLNVFNYICLFLGIGQLIRVIRYAYLASKHSDPSFMPPTVFEIIPVVIIFVCCLGAFALEKNRPGLLQSYAIIVFACLVWQIVAVNYVYACNPDPADINQIVKQEIIAKYSTFPMKFQTFIQKGQQELGCCGVENWMDYGKLPNEVPDSCCGRYSPGNGSAVGHCTESELEQTPGCNDRLFQIRPIGLFVFYWIKTALYYGPQLLVSILALIHSRRLQKQKYLGENEKTPLVSEQY